MSAICIPHLRRKGVERGSGLVIGYLDVDVDVWKGASSNHQARVPTTERSFPHHFRKAQISFFPHLSHKIYRFTHTHKQLWSSSSLNCVGAVSKEQKKKQKNNSTCLGHHSGHPFSAIALFFPQLRCSCSCALVIV